MLPTYTSVIEDYLGSWTNHYDIHKNALFQKKKKKKTYSKIPTNKIIPLIKN